MRRIHLQTCFEVRIIICVLFSPGALQCNYSSPYWLISFKLPFKQVHAIVFYCATFQCVVHLIFYVFYVVNRSIKLCMFWCPFKLVISSSSQIFYLVCLQSCVGTKWSSSHYSSVLCYLAEKYQTEKVTMYSRSQRYQRHHCQRVVALIIWTSILSLHIGCANHHRSKSKFLYEIWLFYEGICIVILWVLARRASVSGNYCLCLLAGVTVSLSSDFFTLLVLMNSNSNKDDDLFLGLLKIFCKQELENIYLF